MYVYIYIYIYIYRLTNSMQALYVGWDLQKMVKAMQILICGEHINIGEKSQNPDISGNLEILASTCLGKREHMVTQININ